MKPSKTKKLAYFGILVLIIFVCSELAAFVGYSISQGSLFSWSHFDRLRHEIAEPPSTDKIATNQGGMGNRTKNEVLHPYLGYVIQYADKNCPDFGFCDSKTVNKEGAPIIPKTDDNFIVGVFGGSFAHQTPLLSTKAFFEQELKTIPALSGKTVVIIPVALGGYKQPQTLMALNYFLSLGAHFDIVINIDGFNEVALPARETFGRNVYPFFPRLWHRRVRKVTDFELLSLRGSIEYFTKKQRQWSQRFIDHPVRYSVIGNLLWQYNNKRWANKISQVQNAIIEYNERKDVRKKRKRLSFVASGPKYEFKSNPEFYADLARNWSRSSLQMSAITRAYGFEYFHFLQPNQYVENSKPMSDEEKANAIIEKHPYRKGVIRGYPELIKEGKWLSGKGVNFYDLTQMFASNTAILYRDACCHLNQQGYDLIIKEIVREIKAAYTP